MNMIIKQSKIFVSSHVPENCDVYIGILKTNSTHTQAHPFISIMCVRHNYRLISLASNHFGKH